MGPTTKKIETEINQHYDVKNLSRRSNHQLSFCCYERNRATIRGSYDFSRWCPPSIFRASTCSRKKMNDEGYGCWCYFYEKHGRVRGAPVDELDGFCKILHEGYECSMIDSVEAGDDDCVPWEVSYIAAVGGTEDQIREGCINNNPNNTCAQNACSVEGYFVENLVALALSGNAADYDSFGHTQGGFDAIEQCPTKKGNGGGEKECCGNYPLRYPFKVLDGDRACCGTRTYKTSVLSCCNDGSVKANC